MSEPPTVYEGDYVPIASCTTPTEAHLLKETLAAAGLSSEVADANFVQANSWLSNAVGGVKVMVPASRVDEARKVLAAFHEGAFELESAETGPAHEGAGNSADNSTDNSTDHPAASDPRLKTFWVYRHPTRKPAVMAVKKGFSWSAFFIGPLWFLLNGMWLTFFLSLSLVWGGPMAVRAAGALSDQSGAGIQSLVLAVFGAAWVCTGLVANFLLGDDLKRKGYSAGPAVRARSAAEAIKAS